MLIEEIMVVWYYAAVRVMEYLHLAWVCYVRRQLSKVWGRHNLRRGFCAAIFLDLCKAIFGEQLRLSWRAPINASGDIVVTRLLNFAVDRNGKRPLALLPSRHREVGMFVSLVVCQILVWIQHWLLKIELVILIDFSGSILRTWLRIKHSRLTYAPSFISTHSSRAEPLLMRGCLHPLWNVPLLRYVHFYFL